MSRGGPCLCGATDCPSCGPAQGYEVRRVWVNGRVKFINPEDDDEDHADEDQFEPDEPDGDDAADDASDRYERDLDRTASQ